MSKCYISVGCCEAVQDHELKLIGELLVATHNVHGYEQMAEQMKPDADGSPLDKHSVCLKRAEALAYKAEQYRLLSGLYESTANRPKVSAFIDELVELLDLNK